MNTNRTRNGMLPICATAVMDGRVLSRGQFRDLLQHTRKKTRIATDLFFVDGWRWLEDALKLREPPSAVIVAASAARTPREEGLLARAREVAGAYYEASDEQVARLAESVSSPGVVALVRWRAATLAELIAGLPASGPALVVAFDDLGDPGNAGALIRTGDWFGASGVVFGGRSVDPTNAKVVRATMGSLLRISIVTTPALGDTFPDFRAAGFSIAAATVGGEIVGTSSWAERLVLIIGNEARGIDAALLPQVDRSVSIPSYGEAESLNAAIAGSILIADWRRTVS